MTPFELDQKITLQRRVEGKDASGALAQNWENLLSGGDGRIWAKKTDMSGRQYMAAGATQNEAVTRWRIRSRPGVLAKMRILHGDDVYDIDAVLAPDNRWLDLMCTRGTNDG